MLKEKKIQQKFQNIKDDFKTKPTIVKNCINAFIIGGFICDIGQIITKIFLNLGYAKDDVSAITSILMIFLGAFLTGIGIYDKVAEFAGAGTVVPITGFSNAIVSCAMEFKKEGFIFGVAAKMFTIAGPVLVYGIGSSVLLGIIYYFIF